MNEDYLKEMKPKKNKGVAVIIVILILCVLGLGGYIVYDKLIKKEPVKTESKKEEKSKEQKLVAKLDETKDWIYDAEYEKNVKKEKFDDNERDVHLNASNIVAPYININSEDSNNANNEIKNIFDDTINVYNYNTTNNTYRSYVDENYKKVAGYEGFDNMSINMANEELLYDKYKSNNIISVLLKSISVDVLDYSYYTYNFNLQDGKKASYEDVYTTAGFTKENIDENVENGIKTVLSYYWKQLNINNKQCDLDCNLSKSFKNYNNTVTANTLRYYLDSNNNLNIIVNLTIPVQQNNYYTIITLSPNKEVQFDKSKFDEEE